MHIAKDFEDAIKNEYGKGKLDDADRELIVDRLLAAINLGYSPEASRSHATGVWEQHANWPIPGTEDVNVRFRAGEEGAPEADVAHGRLRIREAAVDCNSGTAPRRVSGRSRPRARPRPARRSPR